MNVKDTELLPCPFCGNKGKIEHVSYELKEAVFIQCLGCESRTKSIFEDTDYCAVDEAIKLWNKRADLDKLQQLLNDESEN